MLDRNGPRVDFDSLNASGLGAEVGNLAMRLGPFLAKLGSNTGGRLQLRMNYAGNETFWNVVLLQ